MTFQDITQVLAFISLLCVATPLLGRYMYRVFTDQRTLLSPVLRPMEHAIYRLSGVRADAAMDWRAYTVALLAFNGVGFVVLFVIMLLQGSLPLNPAGLPNVGIGLAFNTAVSFVTNTNWQSYAGETTLSYLTQMAGLAVQNFVSAGVGIAVMLALTRGLVQRSGKSIGNFWVDLVRATLYVLLPLSIIFAFVLVSQGVVQNFSTYTQVTTPEGITQTLPQGPAASQIAIKQIGTNGGGFFNTNSAHPYENPTPLSNFLEMFAILALPAALTYTYGKLVGSTRQGWAIFAAMLLLFAIGLGASLAAEYAPNPALGGTARLEGKEVRFGVTSSILWQVATTSTSNGSVNSMHDSASPLAGLVAMLNIMLGEVIFGGVGAGLYGILVFVILTVFIAGLMVGRTPEYLGKKVESREIQMAIIAILLPSAAILLFSALASVSDAGLSSLANKGPHGLSEILYAFSSAGGNNGSAFAGLNANTDFYNILLGISMIIGRFGVIVPVMAIAGAMAGKRVTPPSSGTFPTDRPLFVLLLAAIIIIVGALTFFPALSLGPVVEHFLAQAGRTF